MKNSEWEDLGQVTIDTARILLIDPVFANSAKLCVSNDGEHAVGDGRNCTAVIARTGIGDGNYRVEGRFVEFDGSELLAEIRVRFLGDEWETKAKEKKEEKKVKAE